MERKRAPSSPGCSPGSGAAEGRDPTSCPAQTGADWPSARTLHSEQPCGTEPSGEEHLTATAPGG
ncbi:hypothetical protein EYF80_023941 [Liparis tanakae]|uniref:Uncharacterized protein n=1 Tax=Liparis tanakae TaxID=230148 RepID=A0A4Z2HIP7_9TELE|nr:hypothetical protein EYF80_023941 [Liparis tanakae]